MQANILTTEEKRELNKQAIKIFNHVLQLAVKEECKDIPEFWSYNLIDLVDYMIGYENSKYVAGQLCKYDIPLETKGHLKKYFNLFY